jgi:hypothetical protein
MKPRRVVSERPPIRAWRARWREAVQRSMSIVRCMPRSELWLLAAGHLSRLETANGEVETMPERRSAWPRIIVELNPWWTRSKPG